MHTKPTLIFFGSFLEYSANCLKILADSNEISLFGVVTTPPKPAGRKQQLKKTHVHEFAESHRLPVYTPEVLDSSTLADLTTFFGLENTHVDLFVVAGYGKLLPKTWLAFPSVAPINIHLSFLPEYRGAMPGEWAILQNQSHSGVTLIEMSPTFDTGNIISRQRHPITLVETRESLYTALYNLGAHLLLTSLSNYLDWKADHFTAPHKLPNIDLFLPPIPQPSTSPTPYAKLIPKESSFIPWTNLTRALSGDNLDPSQRPGIYKHTSDHWPIAIERATRALHDWPGVWTEVPTPKGLKRLKIHSAHLDKNNLVLDLVQLEGTTPTSFNQIKNQIHPTLA